MSAALVSSLEQAGEGSREMDAEVYAAVTDGDWKATRDGWIENPGRAMATTRVTTSLDAALALAERLGLDGWNTLYAAMMNWKAHDPRGPLSQTLPLALCLAILKATHQETT